MLRSRLIFVSAFGSVCLRCLKRFYVRLALFVHRSQAPNTVPCNAKWVGEIKQSLKTRKALEAKQEQPSPQPGTGGDARTHAASGPASAQADTRAHSAESQSNPTPQSDPKDSDRCSFETGIQIEFANLALAKVPPLYVDNACFLGSLPLTAVIVSFALSLWVTCVFLVVCLFVYLRSQIAAQISISLLVLIPVPRTNSQLSFVFFLFPFGLSAVHGCVCFGSRVVCLQAQFHVSLSPFDLI